MRYYIMLLFLMSTVSAQESPQSILSSVLKKRESDRRVASMNKLKEIAIALHSYDADKGNLPARSIRDSNGKDLLSWRVTILPYLGQHSLYEEFRLDESWDSEHNKKLLMKMPKLYQNPNQVSGDMTLFLAVASKESAFGSESSVELEDIADGVSKTLVIVEVDADQGVPWTKPSDWNYDVQKPRNGIGKLRVDGFLGLFCDGRVHFLDNSINDDALYGMITIAGGEMVEAP